MTRLICPKCGSVLSGDWCNDCGIEISKPIVEKKMQILICPNCQSQNIGQYRMLSGAIWCDDCGLRAEHKESFNPFVVETKVATRIILNSGWGALYVENKLIYQKQWSGELEHYSAVIFKEMGLEQRVVHLNNSTSKFVLERFNNSFPDSLETLKKAVEEIEFPV